MSKFCSRASIRRGNPLPPSTWPLACLKDFSAALAELKQQSAHRHAYVPTAHIVTWTQSNKLGSMTSLNFHCRVTSVHRPYSLHILISFYCFILNCTLHNTGEKIKLQENWLCFSESDKVWTAVFLYMCLGQCSAVRVGWDSCFYLFRCLYPASSFLFLWVRLLPNSPGSSPYPFPHISPTQFDIHTFSSSFYSASGITWFSSPWFLCSCSSTCTEFSRQLSLSLSSVCLWVQFRVCVLAMSSANHLHFAPLRSLIVIFFSWTGCWVPRRQFPMLC